MEQIYQNADGQRYIKKKLTTGQTWWSVERGVGEFYVMGARPSEPVYLVKKECYVFDLDGTLFDNTGREHLVPDNPSSTDDWTTWNKSCHLDKPIEHIVKIAKAIGSDGYEIRYITSRCQDGLPETLEQLMCAGLPVGYVHMRKMYDNRCHTEVKLEAFNELSKTHHILAAFEDQVDNVSVLTLAGYNMVKVTAPRDKS